MKTVPTSHLMFIEVGGVAVVIKNYRLPEPQMNEVLDNVLKLACSLGVCDNDPIAFGRFQVALIDERGPVEEIFRYSR